MIIFPMLVDFILLTWFLNSGLVWIFLLKVVEATLETAIKAIKKIIVLILI